MGIDDDMAVEFYLTCSNSLLVVRFATKPELACKKETKAVSIQNEVVLKVTSTSIIGASTPNTTSRYVATPSKKGWEKDEKRWKKDETR